MMSADQIIQESEMSIELSVKNDPVIRPADLNRTLNQMGMTPSQFVDIWETMHHKLPSNWMTV